MMRINRSGSPGESPKSGNRAFDYVYFPAASNGIDRPVPVTAKCLSFAKRQFIRNAAGELMVQVDL
jgi:hypothetical protein